MVVAIARCATLGVSALGLALAACGPSFQVVYEGDARFEHCYAIDDTPTVPMQEKSDCWSQWMKSYTYGQTRNRVDYASMRAKALLDVPAIPTDESLMSAAPGGGTGRVVGHDVPLTTNAFAPPPTTLREGDAGLDAAVAVPVPSTPLAAIDPSIAGMPMPREACTDRCRTDWHTCKTTCKARCGECDRSYRGCMKGCF